MAPPTCTTHVIHADLVVLVGLVGLVGLAGLVGRAADFLLA